MRIVVAAAPPRVVPLHEESLVSAAMRAPSRAACVITFKTISMRPKSMMPRVSTTKSVITSYSIHYTKLYESRCETLEKAGIIVDKPSKVREVPDLSMDERVKLGRLAYWDRDYKQRLGID